MRKILSAFAVLCALAAPAWSAGSIPIALSQQFNSNGQPLVNCQLFIYQVGTVATPQTAFQDTALSLTLPWPVTCDSNGRLPMFYLADGSVHTRLTDANGVVQFDYPSMLVIGPSSGGGGGATVDPTTIASTGDTKFRPTGEVLAGWVKLNALTIGSATSGATQRANADTQNLFIYLWNNCTNAHCPVSGGRGASGSADFSANKTIQLPDWRARLPIGLDDMGGSSAGIILSSQISSGGGDNQFTPGASGGITGGTLTVAQMPSGLFSLNFFDPGHTHLENGSGLFTTGAGNVQNAGGGQQVNNSASFSTASSTTGISVSLTDHAGNQPITVLNPVILGSWYMKL